MSEFDFSILVCTRDRSSIIIDCLEAVSKAIRSAPAFKSEIVVVDNASEDDTFEKVTSWSSASDCSVTLCYESARGLSNARNCGISASKGKTVIFTDDDCLMDVNYINELAEHLRKDTGPILRGGRVELGDAKDLPITIKTEPLTRRFELARKTAKRENLSHLIIGCNMAMSRAGFDIVGKFDEDFGAGSNIPSGEDMDFVYRAYSVGIPIEYVPNMAVRHFHGRRKVAEAQQLFVKYMLGTGALYAKYILKNPDFCRPAFWDLKAALAELFFGIDPFLDAIGFSHRKIVMYCSLGAIKYAFLQLSRRLK